MSYFDKKCSLRSYDWGTPFTFAGGGAYKTDKPWHFRIQIESGASLKSIVSFLPKVPGALPKPLNRKDFDEEFDKNTSASYVSGPFASFPSEISFIVGKSAGEQTWPVKRIRVWAYRIGDATEARFGLVIDVKDLALTKGSVKTFKVTEPRSLGFRLQTFAVSQHQRDHRDGEGVARGARAIEGDHATEEGALRRDPPRRSIADAGYRGGARSS